MMNKKISRKKSIFVLLSLLALLCVALLLLYFYFFSEITSSMSDVEMLKNYGHNSSQIIPKNISVILTKQKPITEESWFLPVVGTCAGIIVLAVILGLGIAIPFSKRKQRKIDEINKASMSLDGVNMEAGIQQVVNSPYLSQQQQYLQPEDFGSNDVANQNLYDENYQQSEVVDIQQVPASDQTTSISVQDPSSVSVSPVPTVPVSMNAPVAAPQYPPMAPNFMMNPYNNMMMPPQYPPMMMPPQYPPMMMPPQYPPMMMPPQYPPMMMPGFRGMMMPRQPFNGGYSMFFPRSQMPFAGNQYGGKYLSNSPYPYPNNRKF